MESLKRTGVCTRSQSARENVGAGGAGGGANALGKHSRAGGRSQPDTADACCTLSNGRKLRGDKSASGSGSVAVGGGKRLANGSKASDTECQNKKRAALSDITNGNNSGAEDASAKTKTRSMTAAALQRPMSHVESDIMLHRSAAATVATSSRSQGAVGATGAHSHQGTFTAGQPVTGVQEDVDHKYQNDPQMCTSYVNQIHEYLRDAQLRNRPDTRYMDTIQRDINPTMRGILVDWLVEVAEEYKLLSDTLYLSANYIDRVLSSMSVVRSELQLVGVTCMLVAAKYEEIYAPQVEEFCYITDNTYTRTQVVDMERKILDTLRFELTVPTTKTFLRRFLTAANAETKVEYLASFLSELTLLEYSFLKFEPSEIAASAVFLSLFTLNKQQWSPTLVYYTRYQPSDLRECVEALNKVFQNMRTAALPAIREKYSVHKFKCVAQTPPKESPLPAYVWNLF